MEQNVSLQVKAVFFVQFVNAGVASYKPAILLVAVTELDQLSMRSFSISASTVHWKASALTVHIPTFLP